MKPVIAIPHQFQRRMIRAMTAPVERGSSGLGNDRRREFLQVRTFCDDVGGQVYAAIPTACRRRLASDGVDAHELPFPIPMSSSPRHFDCIDMSPTPPRGHIFSVVRLARCYFPERREDMPLGAVARRFLLCCFGFMAIRMMPDRRAHGSCSRADCRLHASSPEGRIC